MRLVRTKFSRLKNRDQKQNKANGCESDAYPPFAIAKHGQSAQTGWNKKKIRARLNRIHIQIRKVKGKGITPYELQ